MVVLLVQVVIDATNRAEFAVLDLTAAAAADDDDDDDASSSSSRAARHIIADMPLDSARQHVYAVTRTRVSYICTTSVHQIKQNTKLYTTEKISHAAECRYTLKIVHAQYYI